MSDFLFIYGTLIPGAAPTSVQALVRRLHPVANATVSGALHDLGAYPGITLDHDGVVQGQLVRVHSAATWLRLDTYEGYDRSRPERSLFRRERCVATRTDTQEQVPSWVYVYNGEVGESPRVKGGCWLTHRVERSLSVTVHTKKTRRGVAVVRSELANRPG